MKSMDKDLFNERKEKIYKFFNDDNYKPMKFKEITSVLCIPREDKEEFRKVLEELLSEGKVTIDTKGRYKATAGELKVGTFCGTQKGFGFVVVEGEDEDIFISPSDVNGALNKDTVQIVIKESQTGKRREGKVVTIIERGKSEIIGTFTKSKNFGFVIPDDHKFGSDIYISKKDSMGAVTGHKVVVELTEYGGAGRKPEGKVVEIIGHINDPGVDILSIVKANGIPMEFPEEVMKQVEGIPDEVLAEEKVGREDIRHLQTVTIDGEDAKDLDDAITLTREGDGYLLGVHIADVTHYVTENSPLDKEALKRATSVYLVDRVIPQLPHKLSNGICSLNAGCDRLALSCFMHINKKGEVTDHRIAETLINVDRRMTYTDVNKIVEFHDKETCAKYDGFVEFFDLMEEAAEVLREKRRKRGSIDFDFPESKIILDEKGKPIEIKPYERNKATRIIEDFMLIANETIAQNFFWQEVPFVYRTHENPDPEKIIKLGIFINNFGYTIKGAGEEIHPKEIQKLLGRIEGTPEEALISRLTLRSMKQAKYSVNNEGHFGLATQYYCHFTSPIRRYPDLQIHRIIKESINGKLTEKRISHYNKILPEVANQSSLCESRADEAERATEKLKKVEYMQKHIGETFEGVISGMITWGIYVELPNTVEGLVRVTSLKDDYYFYDEEKYQMVGEHTNKVYNLGEKVKVVVVTADKVLRTIDFEFPEEDNCGKGKY